MCSHPQEKRNAWNIRNIPLIERDLMFRINKMFRNTAVVWNMKPSIKMAMFHMFRMFRIIRLPPNVR